MDKIIDILRVAGEVTRLRIIALLSQGELASAEISNVLGQSQPRVSRHLKLLSEVNIAERRLEGAWVFLKLTNDINIRKIIDPILNSIPKDDVTYLRDLKKLGEIRASREEEAKQYFETIAPEWDKLKSLHHPDEAVTEALKNIVEGQKFELHIDLGSGIGELLELMSDKAKRSEGLDRSRKMLALSRARLDENKNISLRLGDILNLPYDDEVADLVTIHQVLHYLEKPEYAIHEAARILSKNGTLLIVDFAPHNNEELRQLYNHKRLGFSTKEIEKICENYNLELIEVQNINNQIASDKALSVNIFKFKKNIGNIKIDSPIKVRNFV